MAKDFDPWALGSGLADSFTGKITDAYFCFDDNYQNGENAVLKLEVQATDTEVGDNGLMTLMYPCGGNKWEPSGGGASIKHQSGKQVAFNRQSGIGILIKHTLDVMGEDLIKRGDPTDAATWKGLNFDWERITIEYNIRGEKSSSDRLVPVAVAEGGASSSGEGSAAAAPASGGGATAGSSAGMPMPMKVKVKNIAKETAGDFDSFLERVFGEIDGVDAYEAEVVDQGDGSIWASVNG